MENPNRSFLLVSICVITSQYHHHCLQQILNLSAHRRHLQLWKAAYGESWLVSARHRMCSGSNLWRCLRMCPSRAVVDWRHLSRVCECLPIQRHHKYVDGRRSCFTTYRDAMACPNKSSSEAAHRCALWKSDNVGYRSFAMFAESSKCTCLSNGESILTHLAFHRVPFLVLPSLTTAGAYLKDHTDRTWHTVTPTIWLQISLNMSLFTACIPSLRGVIESILISTTAGAIQAPYNLTRTGAGYGVHATAIPLQQLDSSRYFRNARRHGPSLKTYNSSQGNQEEGRLHQPESVRKLVSHREAGRSVYRALSSSHGSNDL